MKSSSPGKRRTIKYLLIAAAAAAVIVPAFLMSGWDPGLLWERRAHFGDITGKMFPPDLSFLSEILPALHATIRMSVTGTSAGAILALTAAPFCAANIVNNRAVRTVLRVMIQVLRSFPALILALAATFLFGLGTFAGSFAIGVYTFAVITRLTYEDVENADTGAYEAVLSTGAQPGPAFCRTVLHEILPGYLSNVLYLFETNVRHGAILGYVGAGGIGILLSEKISWREYSRVGMILISLFITVCIIEYISERAAEAVRDGVRPGSGRRILVTILAAVILVSVLTTDAPQLSQAALRVAAGMMKGIFHPDVRFMFSLAKDGLPYLLLETLAIAVCGTILSAVIALPLSFLGSKMITGRPVSVLFRILVICLRSVPFVIYGLIFIRVTGPGPFAGALTLAMCSAGFLFKRFTKSMETLDMRPYLAMKDMGVPGILCIKYALLPQFIPMLISAVLYRFDINVREASILGMVGAGGIGAPLILSMNKFSWNTAGAVFLGLVVIVWIVDLLSGFGRRKLR